MAATVIQEASTVTTFVNPLAGVQYERAWGPGGGTHAFGQNWQSSWGWDLLHAAAQMPVRAPFDGIVKSVGGGGTGRFAGAKVGIEGAVHSCFLTHMSSVSVSAGERVTAGQVIGTTGQANGVWHLHFAMCTGPYGSPESAGIDPRPFLDGSAVKAADKGPQGYPLYRGKPVAGASKPPWPNLNSLRLVIRTKADKAAGRPGRSWAGRDAANAVAWIARNGVASTSDVALAFKGNLWRAGSKGTVTHAHIHSVAKTLNNRYAL